MKPKQKQFGQKVKQKALNLADPRLVQIAATAGNAAGVVEVPNEPGFIYALSRKGIPYKVLNGVGDIPPRHPIIIGTIASEPNTMRVIKIQDVYWQKLEPRVKPHAKEHGIGGTDPLPIKMEQWMWFKTEPAPDEGPFHVAIYRYTFVTDSDAVLPPSTEYLDLATHVPASGALFVLIELLADGTINVVDGSPVTQRQDLAESDIPLPTSGARRLYAVSLYAGQTRVAIKRDWNDFYDLRFSDLGSGGGGGGATPGGADGDIQFNDGGALGGEATFHRTSNGGIILGLFHAALAAIIDAYSWYQGSVGASLVNIYATWGTDIATRLTLLRGGGTESAPTAVLQDWLLGRIGGRGYDDDDSPGTTSSELRFVANEDFTPSDHGTRAEVWVTPDGTTTQILAGTFENNGDYNAEGHAITNLADNSVPLSKIVNATAQYKLMGRSTAGAGAWEQITSSANVFSILGAATYAAIVALLGLRETLTANRTYYVRSDGNDANTGLVNNSGGAFLTIQKAINVTAALDMSIYDVTIQVGSGTYAEQLVLKQCLGSGTVFLLGDTATPANVVISGSTAFTSDGLTTIYNIQGFKGTGAGSFILSRNGSIVDFGNVNIANTGQQLRSDDSGNIRCVANYTISAGATHHIVSVGGFIRIQSFTVTLTGTPAFSGQFCNIGYTGVGILTGITFSGAATGVRYSALLNGVIYTAAGGANYFPGNAGGSTVTGGQYA